MLNLFDPAKTQLWLSFAQLSPSLLGHFFTFWGFKGIFGGQGRDMSAESVSLNLSTIINLAVK